MIDTNSYRRLCRARDFAAAQFTSQITVEAMAREACLSPGHFHRLFVATFGETPHRFLSSLRLARARALLARDAVAVTDVCLEVGFSSLGSFSTWFSSHTGQSPSAYRHEMTRIFGAAAPWRHIFIPTCFLAAVTGRE